MEIEILFTVTKEYSWTGQLTDLPKEVRKGGKLTVREDGETVVNEEELSERLDDVALEKLAKDAEEQDATYDLQAIEQVS